MYLHKIRTIHGVTRVLVFLLGSLWMKHGMVPLSIKKKKKKDENQAVSGQGTGHMATHHHIITQETAATFDLSPSPWTDINTKCSTDIFAEHCGPMLCIQ